MDKFQAHSFAAMSLSTCKKCLADFPSTEPIVLLEARFVLAIINLNDVLQFLKDKHRITFKDDVENGDITDLINVIRNVACHIKSPLGELEDTNYARFNCMFGAGVMLKTDTIEVVSKHGDDVAVSYGKEVVYLQRHMRRAVKEATEGLTQSYAKAHSDAGLSTPPGDWISNMVA